MNDTNPYSAPSSNVQRTLEGGLHSGGPQAVAVGRGWSWITGGWEYFKRSPGAWILTIVAAAVIYVVLAFIPLIGQLAISLTSYVWIAGYYLGCKAQDEGKPFAVNYLFEGFRDPGKLVLLSLIMTVAAFVIVIVGVLPVALSAIGGTLVDSAGAEVPDVGLFAILLMLVGFLLFIPLAMAAWFAPALMTFHDVSIVDAMKLSLAGCLKNILPMLVYSIVGLILFLIGSIPLGLGLLVVFPVMIASAYVSYKEIFLQSV
ncbi:MAG: BPSS1780 family membrane protein [Gammaproteobacteria bacterium]